jgi:hypothetical protein
MVQHFVALTLCTNSSNNIFSILEMEPLESITIHFFLWKDYFFFLYTNYSHIINIWYVDFIKWN